jgi:RNA polymerase sigma-70 factor (ECF subfamily)
MLDSERFIHASFLEHLKPLQGALEAYCRRSVYRSAEVEDVLQNAVMKAYRDFDKYAEGSCFRAWIFKYLTLEILAGNRSVRRHAHEQLSVEPAADSVEVLYLDSPSPQQLADATQLTLEHCDEILASAIWELRPLERSSLLLHAVGEFKYREIADILDLPIGTVMSHLSRARQRIRERLAEWSREHNLLARRGTGTA